jgi:hypothetical protein
MTLQTRTQQRYNILVGKAFCKTKRLQDYIKNNVWETGCGDDMYLMLGCLAYSKTLKMKQYVPPKHQ